MPVVRILSRYTSLKGVNMPIANNQHVVKVTEFHKSLKNVGGKTLNQLQVNYFVFVSVKINLNFHRFPHYLMPDVIRLIFLNIPIRYYHSIHSERERNPSCVHIIVTPDSCH